MKSAIAFVALVTLVSCSTPGQRRQTQLMDDIEGLVKLPEGAAPLSKYARFYAEDASGEIMGVYVIPDPPLPADAGCSELQPDMSLKPVDCDALPEAEWQKVKANERQWLDQAADLPGINDGGCGIVTVLYLPSSRTIESATCNGEA